MKYVIDLETVGVDGGSALDVMTCGIDLVAIASSESQRVYDSVDEARGVIETIFDDPANIIIMHNCLFDLSILLRMGLVKNIRAKVHDTRVLAWLLSSSRSTPRDLKSLVRRLFNVQMRTYEEAYIANPEMLRSGDLQSIVELLNEILSVDPTDLKLFRATVSRIRNRKIFTRVDHGLDLVLSGRTTPEMRADVVSRIEVLIRSLKQEINALGIKIRDAQKEYAKSDAVWTLRLYDKLVEKVKTHAKRWRWFLAEMDVQRIAIEMTLTGIRLDRNVLLRLSDALTKACEEIKAETFNNARQEFNMNSTDDVRRVLFMDLGIEPPVFGEEDTDEGMVQVPKTTDSMPTNAVIDVKNINDNNIKYLAVDKYVLERIRHPVARGISSHRTADKLLGTYIQPYLASSDGDPILHAGFNPLGTQTGRWSSSNPNLQNVPSRPKGSNYDPRVAKIGPELRRAFVARPGKKFIVADLSQIELRLAGFITCDEHLAGAYTEFVEHEGRRYYTGDIHAKTAKALSVSRKLAKNINFGLLYGMSARLFAIITPLLKDNDTYDIEQAAMYRQQYFDLYPNIPAYIRKADIALETGVKSFPVISGHDLVISDVDRGSIIFNHIVQGSASYLLKMSMIVAQKYARPKLPPFRWLLQIHDELCVEVDEQHAEEVAIVLKASMEYPWVSVKGGICPFDEYPVFASVKICDSWWDKDDDAVPEVGGLYTEYEGGHKAIITPDMWPKFLTGDKPTVKASVATLLPHQEDYAKHILRDALKGAPFFSSEFYL